MRRRILTAIYVLLATATVAQSRRWFSTEVNCWITQEKVPVSWEDAQQRCEKHGAILASPLNTQLFDYMQKLITVHDHSVAYFTGTRAKRSEDGQVLHYESLEGKLLDDLPKDVYDAIELLDLEQGDCLAMNRHGIRAVSCWDHLPYICYSNETGCGSPPPPPTSTSAPLISSTIPPGYKYYSATGSWYRLYATRTSWDVANTTCTDEGTHLVVINDATELSIVMSILQSYNYLDTWIGIHATTIAGGMDWRTVHGTPVSGVYHAWASERPYNKPKWTCVVINLNKMIYDMYCDYQSFFMCEVKNIA